MVEEGTKSLKALLEIIFKERHWHSEEYPKSAAIKARIFKNDGMKLAFLLLTAIVILVPMLIIKTKTGILQGSQNSYSMQRKIVILSFIVYLILLLITYPIWNKLLMRTAVSDITLYEGMFNYKKRDVPIIEYAPYNAIESINFKTHSYKGKKIQYIVNIKINDKSYDLLYGTDINEEMLVKFIYECVLHDVDFDDKKFVHFLSSARRSLFTRL